MVVLHVDGDRGDQMLEYSAGRLPRTKRPSLMTKPSSSSFLEGASERDASG